MKGSYPFSGIMGVEINLKPGIYNYAFPDVALLRGKKIRHIVIANNLCSVAPSGNALFDFSGSKSTVFLTFQKASNLEIVLDRIAAKQFLNPSGAMLLLDHVFNFPKSTIEIDRSVDIPDSSIYFLFLYEEPAVMDPSKPAGIRIDAFELEIAKARTFFLENNNLKGCRFQTLLFSFVNTPNGNSSIDEALSGRSFLTLQKNNLQFMSQIPINFFMQQNNYWFLQLQNIAFDFPNSFIDVVNYDAGTDKGKSVFFNCIYQR